MESATNAFEEASLEARDGMRNISSVAEKIDTGKGLLGKLVNEDETYNDLRVAVQGFKNYLSKIDRLQVVFDSHFESMHRQAESYEFEDAKGYFDIRIHPNEDHFYKVEFATSEKGFLTRKETDRLYLDEEGKEVDTNLFDLAPRDKLRFIFTKKKEKRKRNTIKLGLQFGKIYKDIAFRFGLFEGIAGIGVDIDLPLNSERFRWVTTFEAFDLAGWNRKDDRRPHVKWLNKMYILNNVYVTFGADDFVSKRNASAFWGAGLRFGDDDIKYFFSTLSGVGGSNLG